MPYKFFSTTNPQTGKPEVFARFSNGRIMSERRAFYLVLQFQDRVSRMAREREATLFFSSVYYSRRLQNAKRKAWKIMSEFTQESWPEDDWFSLSEQWDLNLWRDGLDGSLRATLFPVFSGNTYTPHPVEITTTPGEK